METYENPILGTDQASQAFKMGLYTFFTARNTFDKDGDSRAEQHICDCVRYPRWSSSKFAGNFSTTICGVICGAFANYTNVKMPTRNAARGRNLRSTAPRWRCSNAVTKTHASLLPAMVVHVAACQREPMYGNTWQVNVVAVRDCQERP
jgi:hypothetical protein